MELNISVNRLKNFERLCEEKLIPTFGKPEGLIAWFKSTDTGMLINVYYVAAVTWKVYPTGTQEEETVNIILSQSFKKS